MVGEKASGSWDVLFEAIETPPNVVIRPTILGQSLSALNGHTIYTGPAADCDGSCLALWRPVEAPWLARPVSDAWAIAESADGLPQWTYKDQPLFTYDGDYNADDRNGLDAEGEWTVMVLQDAPAIPEWVDFQETDIGPVMTTADRMTLYYIFGDWEKIRLTTCDEACVEENWDPMIAPDGSSSIGNWATRPMPDGRLQWTYLGRPVSTFKGDRMPGDTYGDKFGTGSDIRGGWVAILQETLIQNLAR
jgi:predicted lipoprotein with Yx(FWY)xxD motif